MIRASGAAHHPGRMQNHLSRMQNQTARMNRSAPAAALDERSSPCMA